MEITKYSGDKSISLMRISEEFFKSEIFPNVKNAAGAFAIVHYGYELGLPPMASLQTMSIVKGKICMSAGAMLTLAQSQGVTYDVLEESETKCRIDFAKGDKKYLSSFTIEEAKQADLVKKDSAWEKYPKDLLFCRAVTRGLRRICPGAVLGLYDPEELSSLEEKVKVVDIPKPSVDDTPKVGEEPTTLPTPPPRGNDKGVTKQDVKDIFPNAVYPPKDKTEFEQATQPLAGSSESIGRDYGLIYGGQAPKDLTPGEDRITDPQIKAIRTLLSGRGMDAFYINFKKYLKRINILEDAETLKSMTKSAAWEFIGNVDECLVSFFMLVEYHDEMKRVFNFLDKKTKIKILMTLTYFVKDIDSLPKKITEDLSDEHANNYFELFLKAIANQYEGVLPSEHKEGLSKEEPELPPPDQSEKYSPTAVGASIDEHFSKKEGVKPDKDFGI